MASWQLQEAKARLSELVKSAEQDGPQEITVHGRAAAVVVSARVRALERGLGVAGDLHAQVTAPWHRRIRVSA